MVPEHAKEVRAFQPGKGVGVAAGLGGAQQRPESGSGSVGHRGAQVQVGSTCYAALLGAVVGPGLGATLAEPLL